MDYLSALPQEITEQIFHLVASDPVDDSSRVLKDVLCLSKKLHTIIIGEPFHRVVSIESTGHVLAVSKHFLVNPTYAPLVRILNCNTSFDESEDAAATALGAQSFLYLLQCFTGLETLRLPEVASASLKDFWSALQRMRLKNLSLATSGQFEPMHRFTWSDVSQLSISAPHLTSLVLDELEWISPNASQIQRLPCLSRLALVDIRLNRECSQDFMAGLSKLVPTGLSDLDIRIDFCDNREAHLAIIKFTFSNFPALKRLKFTFRKYGDYEMDRNSFPCNPMASHLTHLTDLELRGTPIFLPERSLLQLPENLRRLKIDTQIYKEWLVAAVRHWKSQGVSERRVEVNPACLLWNGDEGMPHVLGGLEVSLLSIEKARLIRLQAEFWGLGYDLEYD